MAKVSFSKLGLKINQEVKEFEWNNQKRYWNSLKLVNQMLSSNRLKMDMKTYP